MKKKIYAVATPHVRWQCIEDMRGWRFVGQ